MSMKVSKPCRYYSRPEAGKESPLRPFSRACRTLEGRNREMLDEFVKGRVCERYVGGHFHVDYVD